MGIKGISITLYEPTISGTDDFGHEEVTYNQVTIENVVVGQPSSEDITSEIDLTGKHVKYNLAIPADDTHEWENAVVEFYGKKWRTIGSPVKYIDGFMGKNFPWNQKIGVEDYE